MSWAITIAVAATAITVRAVPLIFLHEREAPDWLKRMMPWLPITIAGTFLGVLHVGVAGARIELIIAGLAAGVSVMIVRNLYLPVAVGAATLAAIRYWDLL